MKLRICLIATALIVSTNQATHRAGALQPQSTTATSPLTITLSTTSNRFKIDSPIPVEIVVTNISKSPINLEIIAVPHSEYYGYRFTLTLNGNNIPKTSFYKALSDKGASDPEVPFDGSVDTYTMAAGKVEHVPIDVKKLFLITQPGSYLFSVEMGKNMDNKVAIHSQPLQLNIAP